MFRVFCDVGESGGIGMYVVSLRRFRVIITIIISNRVVLLE